MLVEVGVGSRVFVGGKVAVGSGVLVGGTIVLVGIAVRVWATANSAAAKAVAAISGVGVGVANIPLTAEQDDKARLAMITIMANLIFMISEKRVPRVAGLGWVMISVR